ncbi:type I DNA topoisomerase [Limnothrix sp. FACHB-1083]|uniref:type I DNA topoisomerase n=1 Tax=unclassified Limnothrix TaxID=2632864 RepID=UPI001680C0C4|nr:MULTISPECIES: type I DNA topoisomerase [unclassified Limnothrix]MBD2159285.1 type I DNA topoisomerase [Limnothrix sp. FACHB-1083]MBD2191990.1 type I DNA topoisomerase [Limnothrix sp. FACHB-1088]
MTTLVIVESPTKAKTIRNFLPSGYQVTASMGHIRDLPQSASEIPAAVKGEQWAQLGVNIEKNFEPLYVIPKDKKKVVKELQDSLKLADELVLATDEDREGESISWHLLQVLKPKVPVKRMVFHEITEEAIRSAIQNCRQVNDNLVHAQETRRILDRLVGYTLSPLLWKKIAAGLSAGRVQSVAVRMLVIRERARRAFKTGTYWDLKAALTSLDDRPFEAKLVALDGKKLATGADFDEATGQIAAGKKVVLLNEEQAQTLRDRLRSGDWTVADIEERPNTRKPSPPFTTSTLQQEANRKLRLSARDTMRTAQSLYEQGYITYMRTDSVHLSQQAIEAARACVTELYGANYLSPQPRQYATKAKGAQEAHEAIRPAGSTFRTPQQTGLSGRELQLYDLIWKRTVACQMADARQTFVSAQIRVENAEFRASGKRIDFPGFFRAYVEGSDDPDAAIEDREVLLPPLTKGDRVNCQDLEALRHDTQPPARYTEAALVKMLENEGIGRPSTYASIIGTIVDRGYAQQLGNALVPTFTAFAVTGLLENHFPDLVDFGFTAQMERTLDEISTGKTSWLPYLRQFYLGDGGLDTQVKVRESAIDPAEARTIVLEDLNADIRIGRYGAYVEVVDDQGATIKASLPKDLTPADLDAEQIAALIRQKTEGPASIGNHPETGESIYVLTGAYGPYVQLGEVTDENPKPKRTSLPRGVTPENLTLELALGLLSLPRLLGQHPETSRPVKASLGRFGPYIVHDMGKDGGQDYRSLKADDDVTTITLERALELLAQPKASRSRKQKTPLRELGPHPDDNEPVNLYQGPYGIYVQHGKVNAGLAEGQTVESLTLAEALELLAAKAGSKKKTARKTASKTTGKTTKTTSKTASKTTGKTTSKTTKAKTADAEAASEAAPKTTRTRKAKTTEDKAPEGETTRSTRSSSTRRKAS